MFIKQLSVVMRSRHFLFIYRMKIELASLALKRTRELFKTRAFRT